MKRQTKLESAEQQHVETQQSAQQNAATEFASAEAMLRHDALHTPVPPAIAQRLQDSISQLPKQPRSIWRRMFGPPES